MQRCAQQTACSLCMSCLPYLPGGCYNGPEQLLAGREGRGGLSLAAAGWQGGQGGPKPGSCVVGIQSLMGSGPRL